MNNSLCSGMVGWHRDHDTLVLTVFRVTEMVHPSTVIEQEKLAEIALGDTLSITEGGVHLHISNAPIEMEVRIE